MSHHCDLDLEDNKAIFLHDTPAQDTYTIMPNLVTNSSTVQKV